MVKPLTSTGKLGKGADLPDRKSPVKSKDKLDPVTGIEQNIASGESNEETLVNFPNSKEGGNEKTQEDGQGTNINSGLIKPVTSAGKPDKGTDLPVTKGPVKSKNKLDPVTGIEPNIASGESNEETWVNFLNSAESGNDKKRKNGQGTDVNSEMVNPVTSTGKPEKGADLPDRKGPVNSKDRLDPVTGIVS